jgi:antitoxin Phd
MITRTSTEAQNQLGELLDAVQREPVAITRQGKPAAFIISPRDMEDLQVALESRRAKIAKEWEAWREQARQNMTPEAASLTDEEVNRLVHEER